MESEYNDISSWIIILSPAGKYIGCPVVDNNPAFGPFALNEVVCLNPAYEIQITAIPVPVAPGQIALHREISALPFITTIHNSPLWIVPTAIQYMRDLHRDDVERYKGLVNQAAKMCLDMRLKESSIQLATSMPGGSKGRA